MVSMTAQLVDAFCASCGLRAHWTIPAGILAGPLLRQVPCGRCGTLGALQEQRDVDGGAIGPLLKGAR